MSSSTQHSKPDTLNLIHMLTAVMFEMKWYNENALPPLTIRNSHAGETNKFETFLDSLASISVSEERKEVVALAVKSSVSSQASQEGKLLIAENENLDSASPAVIQLKRVWYKLRELVSIFQQLPATDGQILEGVAAIEAFMENPGCLDELQGLKAMIYEHTLPKHSDRLNKRRAEFALFISALKEIVGMMRAPTKSNRQQPQSSLSSLPTEEDFRRLDKIKGYLDEFEAHSEFDAGVHVVLIDRIHAVIASWDLAPLQSWNGLITRKMLKKLPAEPGVDKVQKYAKVGNFPLERYLNKVKVVNSHVYALVSASISAPEVRSIVSSSVKEVPLAKKSETANLPERGNTTAKWADLRRLLNEQYFAKQGSESNKRGDRPYKLQLLDNAIARLTDKYPKSSRSLLAPVHCEVKILDRLLNEPTDKPVYTGVSKLSCGGCSAVTNAFDDFIRTKGSHGKYYFPYGIPTNFDEGRLAKILAYIVKDFIERMDRVGVDYQQRNRSYSESSSPSSDEESKVLASIVARRVTST